MDEGTTILSDEFDSFEFLNPNNFPRVPHLVFPAPQRLSCSCPLSDQTARRDLLDIAIRDVLAAFGVQSTDVLSSESTASGTPRMDDENEGYVDLRSSESWNSEMSFEEVDWIEDELREEEEPRFGEGDGAVSMAVFGSR